MMTPIFFQIRTGFVRMLPLALGVAVYGAVYGILAKQAGLRLFDTMFMSFAVFAGASQMIATEMWVHPLPIAAIVFTTFIVNLRHMLMGAAVYPHLKGCSPLGIGINVFFMTDESWAVAMKELNDGKRMPYLMLGAGFCLYLFWAAASAVGYLAGAAVEDPARYGIDFAFTAVFVALLVGMFKGKQDVLPWLAAAVVAVVAAKLLPGKWYILAGGIAGSIMGAVLHDE